VDILIVFTYGISFQDWDESGLLGREIKIYNKISEAKNITYTFLTFGNSEDHKYHKFVPNSNIYPIYEKYRFFNNKFLRFLYSFYISYSLRNEFSNIDIIKTNQLMGSWIGIILKIVNKTPLIVRTGYDIFIFSIKNKKSITKKIFYYLLTQISLIFCNLYTVSSKADQLFLFKYFMIGKKKISVHSNWVDYPKKIKLISSRYDNKILSVGRLEKQKDFNFLISELENSGIEIDIYGEGSLKSALIKEASINNVKVNFLGKVSNSELLKNMENYKLFCLMSSFEGNPKVILEAMANGCVCVVSNILNNAEIIKNKDNGFLVSKNKKELKRVVLELFSNNEKLRRLSSSGRHTVKNNFSFEKSFSTELKNYKKILKT